MKVRLQAYLGFGLILTGAIAIPDGRADEIPQCLKLSVAVYNRADVVQPTLVQATRVAGEIFRKTGVETGWDLRDLPYRGELVIPVTILFRPLPQFNLGPRVMGMATGVFAGKAPKIYIFYDRVREFSREEALACPLGEILGYAIAHELGHVILGGNSHSLCGIMAARWTARELQTAAEGRFGFLPQQIMLIRSYLQARQY